MSVISVNLHLESNGRAEIHNITTPVQQTVTKIGLVNGTVTIFAPSATRALTRLEYESGCKQDFQRLFDENADPLRTCAHNARWGGQKRTQPRPGWPVRSLSNHPVLQPNPHSRNLEKISSMSILKTAHATVPLFFN